MTTTRVTGAVLLDIPTGQLDPAGKPLTARTTGAVLLDIPNDPLVAVVASINALGTKLDALTAAVAAQGSSGALIS